MKAARFHGARDVRIDTIDRPIPSDDQVLIKVEWCGICGIDLNEYTLGPVAIPNQKTGPHSLTGELLPVVLGHEISGRVFQAPPTSSLRVGQPVVVDPRLSCSSCQACRKSHTNCCEHIGVLGLSGGGGGLSEMIAVSETKVHPLPENADLAAAALIEPLAIARHAVKKAAKVGVEDFEGVPIMVLGAGPVGVAVMHVLQSCGADRVFAIEPNKQRREALPGVIWSVSDPPLPNNTGAMSGRSTDAMDIEVVFDCVGNQSAFDYGIGHLAFGGIYISLATPDHLEIIYEASVGYDEKDFKETVSAFSRGTFEDIERMITSRISLEQVVEKGFEELVENQKNHMKILVSLN